MAGFVKRFASDRWVGQDAQSKLESQFEQLTGFLDAERLGLVERVYTPETARRRRALAKRLGIAPADAETEPLDASLDDLLQVPRSAWGR